MIHRQPSRRDVARPVLAQPLERVPARIGAMLPKWFKDCHEESCRHAPLEALEADKNAGWGARAPERLVRIEAKRQPRRERVLWLAFVGARVTRSPLMTKTYLG